MFRLHKTASSRGYSSQSLSAGRRRQGVPCASVSSGVISKGLIMGKGDAGSWDDASVGNPIVRVFMGDNEQRWYMWYSGRATSDAPKCDAFAPGSGSVGVAVSTDGITWRRGKEQVAGARGGEIIPHAEQDVGLVLAPNKGDWWALDTCHLHPGDVQVLSNSSVSSGVGVYWMFYTGGSFEGSAGAPQSLAVGGAMSEDGQGVEGLKMRPGLAMSQDGLHWARIEGDHHSGALFDVGKPGSWDELFVAGPQVIAHGPRDLRMYYYSFDKQADKFRIGVARSKDGFKWDRVGPMFDGGPAGSFDAHGARNPSVSRDPATGKYLMFYEGVDDKGHTAIGLAVSTDGLTGWKRCPNPVFAESDQEGAWDAAAVGQPCGVSMAAGKWRLYYSGKSDASAPRPWDGIGLALSDMEGPMFEGYPASFKRLLMDAPVQ